MASALTNLVLEKVRSLPSTEAAADFFGYEESMVCSWMNGEGVVPLAAVEKVFDLTKLAPKVGGSYDGQKICVVFPCYKQTNPGTTFSMFSLLDRTRMSVMLQFGDAFIAHTRNQLASAFLKSKAEWMFTVDDDMVLPCGNPKWFNAFTEFNLPEPFASFSAVDRLLSHRKTLVGGLYFGRWRSGKPVYAEGASDKKEEAYARSGPHNICKPTKWVGTGAMLVHRSVFTAIEDKFPNLARNKEGNLGNWFTSSEHDIKHATAEALAVLADDTAGEGSRIEKVKSLLSVAQHRSQVNSSLGTGEDVQFCIRAAQSGHQPHIDMGLVCGHVGSFVYGPQKVGWKK